VQNQPGPQHDGEANGVDDLVAIVVCTLAWGTTWYAITFQLGVVDPVVSVVYRFALAAALLFVWCALRREPLKLTRAQHWAALGVGLFTFGANYPLVYWAEERVSSAVVAVVFAALAFVNLITFRVVFNQRSPLLAWLAALCGLSGVALLSWEEVAGASIGERALVGIAMTFIAVLLASGGNVFARRAEMVGVSVASSTAWAMAYGAGALALAATLSGRRWQFDWSASYAISLVYLAAIGSVLAFLLYYGLARRRGFTTASYISALTPPVAMLVSTIFEAKTWGWLALFGVALVLAGQALLLRVRRD
jgi:drug/metabolite transporter (DMT)-like permease